MPYRTRLLVVAPFLLLAACPGNEAVPPDAGSGAEGSSSGGAGGAASNGGSAGPSASGASAATGQATGSADAGGTDADNGAPSNVYPAPHPALPELVNAHGGPILKTPKVVLVFFPDYPMAAPLETFAKNMTTASYWATVTSEYGVGPLSYGGSITLTGQTPPTMTTSVDIEAWVATELESGAFGTPDPNAIYTLVYPEATTITQPNPIVSALPPTVSCVGFGGYHDNTSATFSDGGAPESFAYAVIPTCDPNVNDITAVMSHEWVEASTDPFLTTNGMYNLTGGPDSAFFTVDADHTVWAVLGGGEAGDLCEPEGQSIYVTPPDVGYLVQRIWSNTLARAGHDPCSPEPSGPYFNAAPVLDEDESIMSTIIGNFATKGVTIPAGSSKTIEVDLYSDGDTNGPFTVSAADAISSTYGSYGLSSTLSFQWDRTEGVNGEKLHLTITVTEPSILDGIHVFMITSTLGNRQAVWPGLVLE